MRLMMPMTERRRLPVLSPRTEFGHSRTICACRDCTNNCEFIPGYLVPADLLRLAPTDGGEEAIFAWARDNLLASPGALVAKGGNTFRIHTLVPTRRADGACHFLDAGRCTVHENAPYGCAFFDAHMPDSEWQPKSSDGLRAIMADALDDGLYARVWTFLDNAALRAPGPEESRNKMRAALKPKYVSSSKARPLEDPTPTAPIMRMSPKVGRNDPCPCGSGKKHKRCCGA